MLRTKLSAEDHGKLGETDKVHYTEKEGSFFLQAEEVDGFALENIKGLRSTIDQLRGENRDLKTKAGAYEGLDAKAAREAMEKIEQMQNWTPPQQQAEQMKAREAQYVEKHSAEIAKIKAENEANASEVRRLLVDVEARRVLTDKEGKPVGSYELLSPIIEKSVRVERDATSGKYVTRVLDKNGNPMITRKPEQDHDMDLEEYILDILRPQPQYAPAFFGSQASGAGTRSPAAVSAGGKKAKVVNASDLEGLGENLEAIASGEVQVVRD